MGLLEKVKNGIVLDGAMSDELEKQGVKTNNPLWTGIALVNQLDAVYQAHTDYFNAGAELVITNTYQANVQAFEKLGYSRKEAEEFIKNAVKIAKKARDDYETKTGKHNYVAATIGSYGAYLADGSEYSGDFELTKKAYLDFHLPRLQLVLEKYDQVISVGINCIKPDLVNDSLSEFHRFTNLPLVVYPNLGATYDPKIKQWVEFKEKFDFEELTNEWFNHGARLIGGCCTTGPKEISEIHEAIEKLR